MRSSFLIAFLVAAISSSTYGVDNIFGVTVDTDQLHTLNGGQVSSEVQAKVDLENEIETLSKKVPANERAWLVEFKKLVTAEKEIIEKLNVPLSQINTDNLEHINDAELRKQISDELFAQLQKGMQDYINMLKTFDFSETVWQGRTFLGNPFTEFMGRMNAANPEGLKATTLKNAFKKAAAEVAKAKAAIFATMASFNKSLDPQNKKSQAVMIEIRNLNLLAVPNTEKKVKQSVKSLATKLKQLQSSIENVNNIPTAFQCFMGKRAWLDEIRTQLNNIDKTHANLNTQLARV